jgi:hypothetical protein
MFKKLLKITILLVLRKAWCDKLRCGKYNIKSQNNPFKNCAATVKQLYAARGSPFVHVLLRVCVHFCLDHLLCCTFFISFHLIIYVFVPSRPVNEVSGIYIFWTAVDNASDLAVA